MTLPVQACSDEELEGYASIHPEAAQELARRIVAGQHSRDAEVEELQSQLRHAEDENDETERQLDRLNSEVEDAINKLRALIEGHDMSEDLVDEINRIANRLEGGL